MIEKLQKNTDANLNRLSPRYLECSFSKPTIRIHSYSQSSFNVTQEPLTTGIGKNVMLDSNLSSALLPQISYTLSNRQPLPGVLIREAQSHKKNGHISAPILFLPGNQRAWLQTLAVKPLPPSEHCKNRPPLLYPSCCLSLVMGPELSSKPSPCCYFSVYSISNLSNKLFIPQ